MHRATSHGEVLRLKPGLYCLSDDYRESQPHPFVIAGMLHSPSHVSLESALSFHGLIPEAVYQVTSVTIRRSRWFENALGRFDFHRVPADEPRAGVHLIELEQDAWAFVAGPIRAIADLVYLRRQVDWRHDGLAFLTEGMRIDEDDLREVPTGDLDEVIASIKSGRTGSICAG